MSVTNIQLLRNIGQFDDVSAGTRLPFNKLTLIYAENGRGKTTLSAVMHSVATGDPQLINERQRLGSQHAPHVVLERTEGQLVFQNGAWSSVAPEIAVFDDSFVASNVCAGIEIVPEHRQNLHELILGAQGVTLNSELQGHVVNIERHNQTLRDLERAIPVAVRAGLSADEFCALQLPSDLDESIVGTERELAAARSANDVRQQSGFEAIELPSFSQEALNEILGRTLEDLEVSAALRVRDHLHALGTGAENWIEDGTNRIPTTEGRDFLCPFCAQDLSSSPIIAHYQSYFSQGYKDLKSAVSVIGTGVSRAHAGDAQAGFERAVRIAVQRRDFWQRFTPVSEIDIDTASVVSDWSAAREAVLVQLRSKAAAPFEAMALTAETISLIRAYEMKRDSVTSVSDSLLRTNASIAVVKEQAAAANVATLEGDLVRLNATRIRHSVPVSEVCEAYLVEKGAKAITEGLRDQARTNLDNYRQNIFPAYETVINEYLRRFNADFRIGSLGSVNTRGGSSCSYAVVINNNEVALVSAAGTPSFRATLSAGDRNTLALAFFFASLEQDPPLNQKIVVVDDPMTSLDEHRSLRTVQEIRQLQARTAQIIVLSHSKPFLCALWEGCDSNERAAIRIQRNANGSTLSDWNVRQDCITEHDKRHALVTDFVSTANHATEREVAAALRPILESFARVSYADSFPPGSLLGPFIGICDQRVGAANEILNLPDITELRALVEYGNRFHHDTNAALETETINDQELLDHCRRTLTFIRR